MKALVRSIVSAVRNEPHTWKKIYLLLALAGAAAAARLIVEAVSW